MTREEQVQLDAMGDRQKRHARHQLERRLASGLPVLARLEGRSFKSLAKGLPKPYHEPLSRLMVETARFVAQETHATVAHTFSGRITLAWSPKPSTAKMLWDGKTYLWNSALAALATSYFTRELPAVLPDKALAHHIFECAAWTVPDLAAASEHFEWLEGCALEHALTAATSAFYDTRDHVGSNATVRLQMLRAKEVHFDAYPASFRYGTLLRREVVLRTLSSEVLALIPETRRPEGPVERNQVLELGVCALASLENTQDVLFNRAAPLSRTMAEAGQNK